MKNSISTHDFKEIKKNYTDEINKRYKYNEAFKKRVDYATCRKKYKVKDHIILYEAFYGRGLVCNPYALFLHFKSDPRFSRFTHVWVVDKFELHQIEMDKYKDDSSVIFVEADSIEYYKYISCAKYLITNSTFLTYFSKKKNQIVINTWHGIPLKHMGYDMPNGNVDVSNSLRNFLMADYILSANKFTTKNFKEAFKLDGIYEGQIIETGYPRIDTIYNSNKSEVIEKFKQYGVDIDPNKKLVLYAPTWKGAAFNNPALDVDGYNKFLDTLYSFVNPDEYQILFKPHQIVYKHLRDKGLLESFYVPATIDTNELLSITDILVSDYSSIFFDFLVTGRPILFYIPDLETYTSERGLYYKVEDLPGPVTKDSAQIGKWIADIDNYKTFFNYESYENTKSWATEYDDGNVCQRIADVLCGNKNDTIVHSDFSNGKIKLLVNNDNMKTNGITSSVTNLLDNLDYDKYDVTMCAGGNPGGSVQEVYENVRSINKNVRVLYRNSTVNGSLKEHINNDLTLYYGVNNAKRKGFFPKDFYEREFNRFFPSSTFDYIINFSGYSNFLSLVYASQKAPKKLIWMHSDLHAERIRFENGERRFMVLDTIHALYDRLVSCANSVMKVNRAKLENKGTKGKFSFAKNLMSAARIEQCLQEDLWVNYSGEEYYANNLSVEGDGKMTLSLTKGVEHNCISFVAMGRLSMEKNYENLIRAFAKLYEDNKNVRLYILGDGPLKAELTALIKKLDLVNKVYLTGNLSNPFSFANECDCYIMPSLHEGQPMAIMEARLLKLPIIISNFSTVADSLYENGQLLVDTSVESIHEGMQAFLDGKVPNEFEFDINQYNKEAIVEFENNLIF